ALPNLPEGELASDSGLVELPQHAGDGGRGRCVPELVRAGDPPVPVVPRVRLAVARREENGGLRVTVLVRDSEIELEVGPIAWKRGDDLFEALCERHPHKPIRAPASSQ